MCVYIKTIWFSWNNISQIKALDTNLIPFISLPSSGAKVFTKCNEIRKNLTSERYTFVDKIHDADIVWLSTPISDFEVFFNEGPHRMVNSCPYDYLMTITAYLSELAKYERNVDDQNPSWFRKTYDMLTEFDSFVAYYLNTTKGIVIFVSKFIKNCA